jgi:hypothetical protein
MNVYASSVAGLWSAALQASALAPRHPSAGQQRAPQGCAAAARGRRRLFRTWLLGSCRRP